LEFFDYQARISQTTQHTVNGCRTFLDWIYPNLRNDRRELEEIERAYLETANAKDSFVRQADEHLSALQAISSIDLSGQECYFSTSLYKIPFPGSCLKCGGRDFQSAVSVSTSVNSDVNDQWTSKLSRP